MTDRPKLKIAIGTYGHTRGIKSGEVPIKGVDPDFVEVTRRHLRIPGHLNT